MDWVNEDAKINHAEVIVRSHFQIFQCQIFLIIWNSISEIKYYIIFRTQRRRIIKKLMKNKQTRQPNLSQSSSWDRYADWRHYLKTLHATQYQNQEAVIGTFLSNDQRNFWNKQLWVMESLDRVDKITKIDNFDWSIYYSLNFTYWILLLLNFYYKYGTYAYILCSVTTYLPL